MTAFEKILSDITSSAQKKAEEIIRESETKAEEIIRELNLEFEQKRLENRRLADKKAENIIKNAESAALLLKRNAMLSYKQELIEEVLSKAEDKINALPDNEYFKFLTNLLKNNALDRSGEISLNSNDLKRDITAFEKELKKYGLSLSKKEADISGGFILSYNGILINCSISALIKEKREILADKISNILFS